MEILGSILSIGAIITVVISLIAKFLPNEKVYNLGYKAGLALTVFGTIKAGTAWEKIEDFLLNSFGQFFAGFRVGLNSDDENGTTAEPIEPLKKSDTVRK